MLIRVYVIVLVGVLCFACSKSGDKPGTDAPKIEQDTGFYYLAGETIKLRNLKHGGRLYAKVHFITTESSDFSVSYEIRIEYAKKGRADTVFQEDSCRSFLKYKILDVNGDGIEELFFPTETGGSGSNSTFLNLLVVSTPEIVGMTLGFPKGLQALVPEVGWYSSGKTVKNRWALKYLDSVKGDYGYFNINDITDFETNPYYAFNRWLLIHKDLQQGYLTAYTYPGCEFINQTVVTLTDGPITYHGEFKGGLIACDSRTKTWTPIYHGNTMYEWPTVLKKVEHYIVLGVHHNELFIFSPETGYFKRKKLKRVLSVDTIDYEKPYLIVNKSEKVLLPIFP